MTSIMSRQHLRNGAPPLPSRGTAQISGRTQSEDHPVIHVRIGRQTSEPARPVRQATPQEAPPPVHRLERRNFETNSFIDRNTARAYSNPDSYQGGPRRQVDRVVYPVDNSPAPPPIATLPRRTSAAGDQRPRQREEPRQVPTETQQAAPPGKLKPGFDAPVRPPKDIGNEPPGRPPKTGAISPPVGTAPGRPPKTSQSEEYPGKPEQNQPGASAPPGRPPKSFKSPSREQAPVDNPCMPDLEKRFFFHSPSDFPPPEPMSQVTKTRASMTKSFIKLDQKERIGHL